MQFEEWLNVVSVRKAIYTTQTGVEIIDKPNLVIMQDNDVPRMVEMLRVMAETMQQIEEHAGEEEIVVSLVEQIGSHISDLIEIDPFKHYEKKKRQNKKLR